MPSYFFPYVPVSDKHPRPHSVIVLSPQAVAGLRARFVRDPQLDQEQRPDQRGTPSPQDQIENNSVLVREVKVLENGWVHAYMTFSTSRSTRERVDLLLPMQDVVAIYSDTTITNNVLDDQMNDGYRLETTRRDEAFRQE